MPGIGTEIAPGIARAYIVPGLPHLATTDDSWQALKAAYKQAGESSLACKPDVLVIYSSQWISVLGHSFQADPKPKGLHVDENWYDLLDFPYEFSVDVKLAELAAKLAEESGLATKLVNYEGFPVDTGTLVALRYFNPENKIPVMIVSSNIYAGQEDSVKLGQAVAKAIKDSGKKAVVLNCSGLSYRFSTDDVLPGEDVISREQDNQGNEKMLELLKQGKNREAMKFAPEYAQACGADMMFKGFYWLMGALGTPETKAKVLAYGPVWGTGAAVVEYSNN